jgi:hypothetical protein
MFYDIIVEIQKYVNYYQPTNMFICRDWYDVIQKYGISQQISYNKRYNKDERIHSVIMPGLSDKSTIILCTRVFNVYKIFCDANIIYSFLPFLCYLNSELRGEKILVRLSRINHLNNDEGKKDIVDAFAPYVKMFSLEDVQYTWNQIEFQMPETIQL